MVVQHNLTAMNSNRMLGVTTATQAKSTEKLSSGYKINRAADDAAGLSISEKMRKQIRGLTQASANAQDGISAVQTAEGALTEVHDMLQRMNELAVKAANGTNSADDRSYIQNEVDQLVTEIDRVAETTKFNETYLLKGNKAIDKEFTASYAAADLESSATIADGSEVYAADGTKYDADSLKTALDADPDLAVYKEDPSTKAAADGTEYDYTAAAIKAGATAVTEAYELGGTTALTGQDLIDAIAAGTTLYNAASTGTQNATTQYGGDLDALTVTPASVTINNPVYDTDGKELTEAQVLAKHEAGEDMFNAVVGKAADGKEYTYTAAAKPQLYDADGNKISANALDSYFDIDEAGTATIKEGKELYTDDKGANKLQAANIADYVATAQTKTAALDLSLHVGADATSNNQITMKIDTMSAAGIGVDGLKVDGKTDKNALDAIETIKAAIQKVSTQRSALGAIQNRLDHTINNLDNVVENTTSAESSIRDTDMATEMVKYSNNNILAQAGQSMLAQANQSNQGVLSLLQ